MSEPSASHLSRRRFLERSLACGAVAAAPSTAAKAVSASAAKSSGERRFSLWCAPGGLISPTQPSDEAAVIDFVEKCARHGVTHLIPTRGSPILAQAAAEKGIVMHPYMAFNSHGARRMRANWSLNYIGLPYGSAKLKEKLDRHRPIWNSPRAVLSVSPFAEKHPDWWALDLEGDRELKVGSRLSMSLAVPEVRSYMVDRYMNIVEESGGHGIQVEFVSEFRDRHGAAIHGYEPPMVEEYRKRYGKSPSELPNHDPDWLRFRAGFVTETLRALRRRLKERRPEAPLSIAVIAQDLEGPHGDRYLGAFQDLRAWLDESLMDELTLWFRTTSDVHRVERHTSQLAELIQGRCPLIVELSCYHVGSFQDPKLMMGAARTALANGAESVGMYRGHAVDQLNFWPLIEEIRSLG
ncbi:MAG: family 10 glycosylhydrolase [Acidobacteriota bacterium]|nr:family 10 glycosylhydrolase [Acidobacteriota bacterium]